MKSKSSNFIDWNLLYIPFFWLLFLLIDILKKSLFSRKEYNYICYYYFPSFLYWILLTVPVYFLFKRSSKFPVFIRFVLLFALGIGFGLTKNLLSWGTYYLLEAQMNAISNGSFIDFFIGLKPFYFIEASIIGCIVIVIFYVLELNKKYRDKKLEATLLESQLNQSRLNALKMQLQPHFLFNAHNTISMLIRTERLKEAITMISKLSDLLRTSLSDEQDHFIILKQEIILIKKYLDIEEIRFEDQLNITFDIAVNTYKLKVPNLILQPIVENAFKHGISNTIGLSNLKIKSIFQNNYLVIKVFNTGPLLSKDFDLNTVDGVGLKNTLSRLTHLYEGKAIITIKNEEDGVVSTLKLPINDIN